MAASWASMSRKSWRQFVRLCSTPTWVRMTAIRKAMLHTDMGEDERLLYQITDHIAQCGDSQMTVEQIQDAVEVELMKSSRKDVAQKYIAYRNQRSIARKAKTRDVFLDIVNIKNNDVTRENANMNADTPVCLRDHKALR